MKIAPAASLLLTSLLLISAHAEVKLNSLFTDNMVLQRDKPVRVWGTAKPGERVTVTLDTQSLTSAADAEGDWAVVLKPMPVARDKVLSVKGENEITLKNIALGDVYVCSGQSNMEWPVKLIKDGPAEVAAANYPDIRLYVVPKAINIRPQKEFVRPASWAVCAPDKIADFSAVSYFFGRELNQKLGVPIGLLNASWSATMAEPWLSRDAYIKRDDLREKFLATEKTIGAMTDASIDQATEDWKDSTDDGNKIGWQTPAFDDAAWPTMDAPVEMEKAGLPDFDGTVWFRRTIDIPAAWEGKELVLYPGYTDDIDTTYWNGAKIGFHNRTTNARNYRVPADLVKAGRTTIAIRVFDFNLNGGITGPAENLRLELAADATAKLSLAGPWKYKAGKTVKQWSPSPGDARFDNNQPTVLYNTMIAPLTPFAVRGVIWYQGESNSHIPKPYRTLFPALIRDWRAHWGAKQDGSEFGFYYVQLANYLARSSLPVEGGWAEIREAQTMALSVPRTGMATILDIGEAGAIHPPNKQEVGRRLALIALAKEYGQSVEYSGPTFAQMKTAPGSKEVTLAWTHAKGLKTTDGQAPRCFAILGDDAKWYAASARIQGETVVLASEVTPTAVRYAWANNPDVNLVNAAGLPAVSFRTDKDK